MIPNVSNRKMTLSTRFFAPRVKNQNLEVPVSVSRACLLAAIASIAITLAAPSSASAQEDVRAEGAKACGPDANRLCKHVLGQGDMIMLKCFKNRRTKLSGTCHSFLTKVGQLK
jgi:hypothetical protein